MVYNNLGDNSERYDEWNGLISNWELDPDIDTAFYGTLHQIYEDCYRAVPKKQIHLSFQRTFANRIIFQHVVIEKAPLRQRTFQMWGRDNFLMYELRANYISDPQRAHSRAKWFTINWESFGWGMDPDARKVLREWDPSNHAYGRNYLTWWKPCHWGHCTGRRAYYVQMSELCGR